MMMMVCVTLHMGVQHETMHMCVCYDVVRRDVVWCEGARCGGVSCGGAM